MPLLLAAFTVALAAQDPPRLRSVLPNDAVLLVEPMASEPLVSVQLWASARSTPETPATHGHRHLLEHLIALGPKRDLDIKLETAGGFLRARTFRDATQFEVLVPPSSLQIGLEAIQELLAPLNASQEEVDREKKIVGLELRGRSLDERLSSAAWKAAYGVSGLDPLGSLESIATASVKSLEALRVEQFAAQNLALVIAGPVPLDATTSIARKLLAPLKKSNSSPKLRQESTTNEISASIPGSARAAKVPGLGALETLSTLAAALALASESEGAFVTYTPTAQNGLIIVGSDDPNLGLELEAIPMGQARTLFARGRLLARSWIERPLKTATGTAYLRGMMLCQGIGYRPEMMLDTLATMKQADFDRALLRFKLPETIVIEGVE